MTTLRLNVAHTLVWRNSPSDESSLIPTQTRLNTSSEDG